MTDKPETNWTDKILYVLLCATIIFTTLAYGAVHQPVIALFYIIIVIIVLLWAINAFTVGTLRFNKSLVQIPLLATVLYALFQVIPFGSLAETAGVSEIPRTISFQPFWTQVTALHIFALTIFLGALLTFVSDANRFRKIALLITVFGSVYAFFAILQAVLSPNKIYGIYDVPYAVPFGSFVNRHNFAAFMEMTLAVPLGLMFVGGVPKDRKLLYITAVGLMGIALILSGSRGGLVSLLAEVFFLVIFTIKTRSSKQLFIKVGFGIVLLATVIAGAILIGGESSLTRIAETAASGDFSANRTHIWNVTLDIIKDNLVFGSGIGAYDIVYTAYDSSNGVFRVEQAHNDYLQVMSDAGIFGLLIAGTFVFFLFRTGFQNIKTSDTFRRGIAVGALAGCFAVFVHSIFDFVLHTTAISLMFLTLVSLVVISGNRFSGEKRSTRPDRSEKKRRSANVTPIEKGRKNTDQPS